MGIKKTNRMGMDLRDRIKVKDCCVCRSRDPLLLLIVMALLAGQVAVSFAMAEGEKPLPESSAREKELQKYVPRSPEALLERIRTWTENPTMDGYDFVEHLAGRSKDLWEGYRISPLGTTVYSLSIFWEKQGYLRNIPFDIRTLQTTKTKHLRYLLMVNIDYCIQPQMVRDFFGEPYRIWIGYREYCPTMNPDKLIQLRYLYKTDTYEVEISFKLSPDDFGYPITCREDGANWYRGEGALKADYGLLRDVCSRVVLFGTFEEF